MKHARLIGFGLGLLAVITAGCGSQAAIGRHAPEATSRVAAQFKPMGVRALEAYYAPAEGKQGRALLVALNQIVARHKDLGYDGARDVMFGQVDDLDNNNVVECVYIGRELSNVTDRRTAFHGGKGLNAEHTWPQSKGAEGAAKADLHHLFPSDCNANSTRGSFPFGEVERTDWEQGGSQRGTNSRGDIVFEPRENQKGDTARAILYFYTVYGQNGRVDLENFRIEEPVLKAWHKQDPVTAEERERNELVYKFQGNRNPFVDHPEFVEKVGTFLGGEPSRVRRTR